MNNKTKQTAILAIGIGVFPPLWAVLSPYLGITTGAVALICAGVYSAAGSKKKLALPMSIGFVLGDLWAVLALNIMEVLSKFPNGKVFITLCLLGMLAVVIGCTFEKIIYLPAWLCGWAIGLTILTPKSLTDGSHLVLQIAVAMLVGVWYVGAGVDLFCKIVLEKKKNS